MAMEVNRDQSAAIDRRLGEVAARRRRGSVAAGGVEADKRWIVLVVSPRCEKAVDESLRDAGVTTWLPMRKLFMQVRHADRRRMVMEPVLRGYLFAKVVPCADAWAFLREEKGVGGFIEGTDAPKVLPERIMNEFKAMVEAGVFNQKKNGGPFRLGQRLLIKNGPFASFQGVLEGYAGTRAVRVLIELLGGQVPVELDLAHVRKLD